MLPLSHSFTSTSVPLIIPSNDRIAQSVSGQLGPTILPPSPSPYASSPRKVHIRSIVSLASEHVLEYTFALHHGLEPESSYDQVDNIIGNCIKMLVDKPEPHTWLHCDAIAMAFCSHILLQLSQMRYLATILPPFNIPPDPRYVKAHLALKYSRHMAWDMVRIAIKKVQSKNEIARLPFAGLCCVLRAGLAVLETREYMEEDLIEQQVELDGYVKILGWFSTRWGIGNEYLQRVGELLGRSCC